VRYRDRLLHRCVLVMTFLLAGCVRERSTPAGAVLYERHCASCHGMGGKGDGPMAASLTTPPADLTTIQRRNGGAWDAALVMRTIDGRRDVAAHGSREMPVWGAVFVEETAKSGGGYAELTALHAGRALTEYVQSLQQR
jgi:mono/diheme cytochrome c family protein